MRTEKDKNDMRTIKFRGKTIDGEWIYGDLIKGIYKDYCYIIQKCTFQSSDNSFLKINNHFLVNPETVGQFTGLLDKNGKEIYEGDVVTWIDSDKEERIDTVLWKNGGLILCNQQYTVGSYLFNELKVIGNLHDNPSLLSE